MIHEYAILPGVFAEASYSSPDACELSLRWLKKGLLQGGLVRNLHGGEWETFVKDGPAELHMRGKELLKKLVQQGRLELAPKERPTRPEDDLEWLEEAEKSHATSQLNAVIASQSLKNQPANRQNPFIAAVESLDNFPGWCGNHSAQFVQRNGSAYLKCLGKLMRTSRSVMLIDPHLDPSERRYNVVRELLYECRDRAVRPSVEIHRVAYKGAGATRIFPDWKAVFQQEFGQMTGIFDSLTVFIWDDFHDRYLISNLMGIAMQNGFDVDHGNMGQTTWSRMEREMADAIQRDFDRAAPRHTLINEFRVF